MRYFFLLLVSFGFLIACERGPLPGGPTTGRAITVDWMLGPEADGIGQLPMLFWTEAGSALLYNNDLQGTDSILEWLDPETGARRPAVSWERLEPDLVAAFGTEEPNPSLPAPSAVSRDGSSALYELEGELFVLDLDTGALKRLTWTPEEELAASFSPDGSNIAFVRANDLHVIRVSDGAEQRLTRDGSETTLNGTYSWVYWEEISGRNDIGYRWSEDSQALAFLQTDESPVSVFTYVGFESFVPEVWTQRYPVAGDPNPEVRLGVIELGSGRITWAQLPEDDLEYLIRVKWLPHSRELSAQTMNRRQDRLDLYLVDRQTGAARHLLTETDSAWVNIHDDLYFLPDGCHLLWASERDGFAHLYRFTLDGDLVNRVTSGEWSLAPSGGGVYWVRQAVVAIDESAGVVYLTAAEKSPLERHLYRVNLDGTGFERITTEEGVHGISFSLDARHYADAYSGLADPPSLSVHRADGSLTSVITEARGDLVNSLELAEPELFTIPARDGFPLPAMLYKPRDFDPRERYPLIIQIYGGPAAPSVQKQWQPLGYFPHVLTDNGFVVLAVDNRSATGISKELENTVYGEAGISEVDDLLDATRWIKAQPYIDPERVGAWGWSYGGILTVALMEESQEFRAGIAGGGVMDWRYYDTKWAEFMMGTPTENPQGYERTSLVQGAERLHGTLLLIHGTWDPNVHVQNALALADALVDAGKMFEMLLYPNRGHGFRDHNTRLHYYNSMLRFWLDHLQ